MLSNKTLTALNLVDPEVERLQRAVTITADSLKKKWIEEFNENLPHELHELVTHAPAAGVDVITLWRQLLQAYSKIDAGAPSITTVVDELLYATITTTTDDEVIIYTCMSPSSCRICVVVTQVGYLLAALLK